MDHAFIDNPLNQDIFALLSVSKLPATEKRLWVNMMEYMTDEGKERLKANLEKEVQYEVKVTEQAMREFVAAMQKGIN